MKLNHQLRDDHILLGGKQFETPAPLQKMMCFIYLCGGHFISHPTASSTPALNQLPANQTIRLVHTLFLDATSGFHRNCFKPDPLSIRTFYNFSTLMKSFVVPMVITEILLSLKYCFLIRGFINSNVLLEL